MHFLLVFAQYSCLCIWYAAMSAAADSGAYVQEEPDLTSSENDLRLDLASDVHDYATHEVRQHVSVGLAGSEILIAFADHS
jgi:hypothetical protein